MKKDNAINKHFICCRVNLLPEDKVCWSGYPKKTVLTMLQDYSRECCIDVKENNLADFYAKKVLFNLYKNLLQSR